MRKTGILLLCLLLVCGMFLTACGEEETNGTETSGAGSVSSENDLAESIYIDLVSSDADSDADSNAVSLPTEDPAAKDHYAAYYANFCKRSEEHPGMYAWIYMTDTGINYPVMRKEGDNEYYVSHDFLGNESRTGAIFADGGVAEPYFSNKNMVLYGNNMKDGSMFHSLKTWCNKADETLVQSTRIEIYTREGVYLYAPFSYYIDNTGSYARLTFGSDGAYTDFLSGIYEKSIIRTERAYDADSRICTLVTGTYGSDPDARYVVHGIFTDFLALD